MDGMSVDVGGRISSSSSSLLFFRIGHVALDLARAAAAAVFCIARCMSACELTVKAFLVKTRGFLFDSAKFDHLSLP